MSPSTAFGVGTSDEAGREPESERNTEVETHGRVGGRRIQHSFWAWSDIVDQLIAHDAAAGTWTLSAGGTVNVYCNSPQPAEAHDIEITALKVASLDYK